MKKRILIISYNNLNNGGIPAVIMSIVRNLKDYFVFDVIQFDTENHFYDDEFKSCGGNIYYLKKYNYSIKFMKYFEDIINNFYMYIQFLKFLKTSDNEYTAIHCHNYFNAAAFIYAAKKHNIPIRITHSHNVASPLKRKNPLSNLLINHQKKILKSFSTQRVSCSAEAGKYLFDNLDVKVIHNAIDLDKFNMQKYHSNEHNGINFVHIGRYGYQKNQIFLVNVFNEYLKLDNNAHLTMVGFGEDEQKVKNEITKLKLWDKTDMLPHDTFIPQLLADSDIMIFPSTYEGLGICLIEAQAMGLRCYVSEALQPEANLGLCKALQLSLGAKKWAEFIFNDIKINGYKKHSVDMSSYDIQNIKEEYRKLYTAE